MSTAHAKFHISTYLGHADFKYDVEENLFYLNDPSQLNRFLADASKLQSPEKGTQTVLAVQNALEQLKHDRILCGVTNSVCQAQLDPAGPQLQVQDNEIHIQVQDNGIHILGGARQFYHPALTR